MFDQFGPRFGHQKFESSFSVHSSDFSVHSLRLSGPFLDFLGPIGTKFRHAAISPMVPNFKCFVLDLKTTPNFGPGVV